MHKRQILPIIGLALAIAVQSSPQARAQMVGGDLVFAPTTPQPQTADDIVGLILRNTSRSVLHNQPVTFGEVFVAGKIRSGASLIAKIGGKEIPAQLDAKTTNPDGSVRMGIVTLIVPEISGGARVPVMLSQAVRPTEGEASLAPAQGSDLAIDIAVHGGQTYHLDAGRLLTETLNGKSVSYWLRGPQAVEVRVDKPVTGSLHVTFDVRAYADGTVLTDVALKNDYVLQPVGGPLVYDAKITSNGKIVFAQQDIAQQQYTSWHKLVGRSGHDAVLVVHDIAAVERSNAILDYDLSAGVDRGLILRNKRQMEGEGFGILENAGIAWYMGMTGGRNEIGPTTQTNTIWLLTQDENAQAFALAQADAAGSIPWHFFEPRSGYLTATRYPTLWTDERAAREGLRPLTQQVKPYTKDCSCFYLDAAHEPDLTFVPYIMTGERYYLDELEAQATWNVVGWDARYRLLDKGIVFFPDNQGRAQAWAFRTIINAAWIIPDNDPLKTYFRRVQKNNLDYLLKEISGLHEGEAAGWVPGNGFSGFKGEMSPWQQDFVAYAMILAAKRGDVQAVEVLKWETNFLAGRFLAGSRGYSPYDGAAYRMKIYKAPDQIKNAYQTWAEISKVTAQGGFSGGGDAWPKETYNEYLQAAKGVLAGIVRVTGSDKARRAYLWIEDHAPQADITRDRKDPTWRVALPD